MTKSVSEQIEEYLVDYLGPNTAKTALKTFSKKALGVMPEDLVAENVPTILAAMRPMLRTLLGEDSTRALLARISQRAF
jgi:hypothetical protein